MLSILESAIRALLLNLSIGNVSEFENLSCQPMLG